MARGCSLAERRVGTCGGRGCRVNSLWTWWYSGLVILINSYLLYRAALNCHQYNLMPWQAAADLKVQQQQQQQLQQQQLQQRQQQPTHMIPPQNSKDQPEQPAKEEEKVLPADNHNSKANRSNLVEQNSKSESVSVGDAEDHEAGSSRPVVHLYFYIALIVLNLMCLPLIVLFAVLKTGNYANDGFRLGLEPTTDELEATNEAMGEGLIRAENVERASRELIWEGWGWRFLWRGLGPVCHVMHVLSAYCLLLPQILLEAKYIQHELVSSDVVWRTDLDLIFYRHSVATPSPVHLAENTLNLTSSVPLVPALHDVTPSPKRHDDVAVTSSDGVGLMQLMPSPEFANLALAFCLYSIRYAAVLWYTKMSISFLFSAHLMLGTAYFLLTNSSVEVVYKLMILSESPQRSLMSEAPQRFILSSTLFIVLHILSSSVIFLSSISIFHYASLQYSRASRSFLRRMSVNTSCPSLIGRRPRHVTRCHGYTSNMAAGAFLFAAIGLRMAVVFDEVIAYRHSGRFSLILISVLADCSYALWWIILWLGFTLRQRWGFRVTLLQSIGFMPLDSLCQSWMNGSNTQTNIQSDRQTDRQIGSETGEHTNGRVNMKEHTDGQIGQQIFEHIENAPKTDRQTWDDTNAFRNELSVPQPVLANGHATKSRVKAPDNVDSEMNSSSTTYITGDVCKVADDRRFSQDIPSYKEGALINTDRSVQNAKPVSDWMIPHGHAGHRRNESGRNPVPVATSVISNDPNVGALSSKADSCDNSDGHTPAPNRWARHASSPSKWAGPAPMGSRTPENGTIARGYRRTLQDKCGQLFVGQPGRRRPISWSRDCSGGYEVGHRDPVHGKRRPNSECEGDFEIIKPYHDRCSSDETLLYSQRQRGIPHMGNSFYRNNPTSASLYQNETGALTEGILRNEGLPLIRIQDAESGPTFPLTKNGTVGRHTDVESRRTRGPAPEYSPRGGKVLPGGHSRVISQPQNHFLLPSRALKSRENLSPVPELKTPSPERKSSSRQDGNWDGFGRQSCEDIKEREGFDAGAKNTVNQSAVPESICSQANGTYGQYLDGNISDKRAPVRNYNNMNCRNYKNTPNASPTASTVGKELAPPVRLFSQSSFIPPETRFYIYPSGAESSNHRGYDNSKNLSDTAKDLPLGSTLCGDIAGSSWGGSVDCLGARVQREGATYGMRGRQMSGSEERMAGLKGKPCEDRSRDSAFPTSNDTSADNSSDSSFLCSQV